MHRIDIPTWVRPAYRFEQIDPARTALLAIDMQGAFMLPGQVFANPHACDIVANVNRLAATLRHAGGRVIWTRQTVSDNDSRRVPAWQWDASDPAVRVAMDALAPGGPGHGLHRGLDVSPDDVCIDKYRYSALLGPTRDVEVFLEQHAIDTLIIAGTLTNVCCESSARDGYMLGYRILFAADATAAVTDAEHNATLLNLALHFADVRTTSDFIRLIETSPARSASRG